MNVAVTYSWIKALHVAAAIAFVGGTLAQSFFLAAVGADAPMQLTRRFRTAGQRITIPALLVALAGGLTLAMLGNWFPQRWLIVKGVLVVALLGIHGFQSGQLRRLTLGQTMAPRPLHYVVLALVMVIAALAVVKPGL